MVKEGFIIRAMLKLLSPLYHLTSGTKALRGFQNKQCDKRESKNKSS